MSDMTTRITQAEYDALTTSVLAAISQHFELADGEETPPTPATIKVTMGAGTAKVEWEPASGREVMGVVSRRDGQDTTGYGPWTNTKAPEDREDRFDKLIPGQEYTFTVALVYIDNVTDILKARGVALAPVGDTDTGGGGDDGDGTDRDMPWNSGAYTRYEADKLKEFGIRRGRKMGHAAMFPDRGQGVMGVANRWYLDRAGDVPAISLGLPMAPNGGSLDDDMTPGYAQMIKDIRADGRLVYVRLGWEMNLPMGDERAFAVTDGNLGQWRSRWEQYYDQWKDGLGEQALVGFNPNSGANQSGLSGSIMRAWVDGKVDWCGPDKYNWWEPFDSDQNVAQHMNGYQELNWWAEMARAKRVPLGIPEWGTAYGNHCGGDNPRFIREMRAYFNRQKENLLMEAYFDETDGYIRSSLSQNPACQAEYTRLWSA